MRPLLPGDKVAIVSPASVINPDYVSGAVETLAAMWLRPEVKANVLGHSGSFSGTADERVADLTDALLDPDVKCILCSRGGYGCVHLLPQLDRLISSGEVAPKWLVGFSDVSALHALWRKHGWESVHSSMTKQLALGGPDDPLNHELIDILEGRISSISLPTGFSGSPAGMSSRQGSARGMVTGGNLAVIGGLIGTPYNPVIPGSILLIEDIAEPIYKVERILWQLRLAGLFDSLSGMIVGAFTDYKAPSRDHEDMYSMIDSFIRNSGVTFPVAMDVPVGHIDSNRPVILNREARLTVTPGQATLDYNV